MLHVDDYTIGILMWAISICSMTFLLTCPFTYPFCNLSRNSNFVPKIVSRVTDGFLLEQPKQHCGMGRSWLYLLSWNFCFCFCCPYQHLLLSLWLFFSLCFPFPSLKRSYLKFLVLCSSWHSLIVGHTVSHVLNLLGPLFYFIPASSHLNCIPYCLHNVFYESFIFLNQFCKTIVCLFLVLLSFAAS